MSRRKRRPGQYEEGYERYGMESEDWRHLNDYWRSLYGANYPHDRESYRDYERLFDMRRRVDFRQTKRLAEDIAANVSGVKDVRNELRVQQTSPRRRDDRAA